MVAEIAAGVALGVGMVALVIFSARTIDRKEHPFLGGLGITLVGFFLIHAWVGSEGWPTHMQWIPEAFASDH